MTVPAHPRDFLAGFNDHMEKEKPCYKARCVHEATVKRELAATNRCALVRQHGSENAANAPNQVERIIDHAARPFERVMAKTYVNGTFKTLTIDGRSGSFLCDKLSEALKSAISNAIPLPTTIQEAAREFAAWDQRDDERRLLSGNGFPADTYLSQGFCLRHGLLETGLRAANIADVLERLNYCVALEFPAREIERAVLADLEHLAVIISGDPV